MTSEIPTMEETGRLEALLRYGVLDSPAEPVLDELTGLAAAICEVPIALISLIDERRQWFKARVGLDATEMPREVSFCAYALQQRDLYIVPDTTQDPCFANNRLVTGEPRIRFYAGAPLVTPEGAVLGTLCVLDAVPRKLSPVQEQALRVLSGQVMTQLELRRRGRELEASEAKLRAILEAEPECVKLLDADATLHQINTAGLRLIEADSLDQIAGASLLPLVVPEDREAVCAMLNAVAGGEHHVIQQFRIITLKGTARWLEMSGAPFRERTTGRTFVVAVSHDISARKQHEEKIHRLSRLYSVSSSINEAIVRIEDPHALYEGACRIAVERGGLVMAWVGLADGDDGRLRPTARWGRDDGYLHSIQVLATPDRPEGQGPGGVAFRTGVLACCNDIAADPGFFASKAEALHRGYRSCAAFPLKLEARPTGVLVVYGAEPNYFDREELHVLSSLAENISFAIEVRQREQQRLQAEEALRASEGRYRTLFECAPDGILIVSREGRYLDANESICRMLGHTRQELVGLHGVDIFSTAEISQVDEVLQTIQSQSPNHREWHFRRKNGSEFPVEVVATTMPDGNLLAMVRDSTQRKRSEARFRRLVESNAQGVMFWNTTAGITGANDAFLHILGYSREDMDAGRVAWQNVSPPEFAELDSRVLAGVATGEVCAPFEREYLRKDGSRVPVLCGVAAFEDSPNEGVCFVFDLTERKKLEQQFLRAQRLESIGTLAGGIAHDLNNALGPIIMSLDLLKMNFQDPGSRELLDVISASAKRGADMVRQVLSFARGVEGRRMEVQVGHLLQEIENITNDTFLKHIDVRADIPQGLWTVVGDPTQLHQVLINLCVNARDAMPKGGLLKLSAANVRLGARDAYLDLDARPGPYVCLQIQDSGTGIRPELLDKIFDPFFTTKEVGKGTGLGLSTSLAIVKGHGGFIRVVSELGHGSEFKVYLPAQTEASSLAVPESVDDNLRGRGELILVVDDEPAVCRITQQTLESFGYRALLAVNGAEAVTVFRKWHPEVALVLTDLMMPVMDGAATIQALREIEPQLRIIAASGVSAENDAGRAASLGVEHFLAKPYTAETLLKALRQVLSAQR